MAKLIESESEVRLWLQEPSESQGDLTIELDAGGKPVDARELGKLIVDTCKILENIDRSLHESGKSQSRWAIIEANVIGSRASFTLRGYDKQAFKVAK